MNTKNKILACVDRSHYADYVADYAIWAARQLDAPLKFLHVIDRHPETGAGDDHSGAIGFNAQTHLLNKLSDADAAQLKTAHEQGRVFLNRLRERAVAAGVNAPDMKQRHGELQQTLVEQEEEVDLFMWGRRGEASETAKNRLGRNVEGMVRALHKPILSITEPFAEPQRVMIAFDGGSLMRRAVEWVAHSSLFSGLTLHVLMAGTATPESAKQMEWAKTVLQAAGLQVVTNQQAGDPVAILPSAIEAHQIDILVMGAYAHTPLRSWLFGCKTNAMLSAVRIPTLLMR